MASSKKPLKSSLITKHKDTLYNQLKLFLKSFLSRYQLARPSLLIAYSGGLDSTVLLHLFRQLQKDVPFQLAAMHVHHGLSKNADEWVCFCEEACIALGVPFLHTQVEVNTASGLGVEAAARQARYEALDNADADFICLGHHQDDQAETLLLQLVRGAGVKGLAGMAQVDMERRLLRPLLNISRVDLIAYAKVHQLQWIDDESNADIQYDRNFIRHVLIPTFRQRYDHVTQTLARSATHMAETNAMLDELAELDAAQAIDTASESGYGVLHLDVLSSLSEARQGNLVRWWLAANHIRMPSTALLQQILQQLYSTRSDAAIKVKVADNLYVMRYKMCAYLVGEPKSTSPINLLWQGEEVVILPDLSRLFFVKKLGEGFAYQRGGSDIKLRIKYREGGEQFRPALGRPRRGLKTVMQSCEMPPWQRDQLPLIFMDETIVIIPNIGVDANQQAESHEMGLNVSWMPANN